MMKTAQTVVAATAMSFYTDQKAQIAINSNHKSRLLRTMLALCGPRFRKTHHTVKERDTVVGNTADYSMARKCRGQIGDLPSETPMP